MSTSLGDLIPELQPAAGALVDLANRAGVQPRITSTLRSSTEQARLYRRFLSGVSRLPAAPPGSSAHEYGYAFDMIVSGDDNLADLGSVWRSWGGVWGGGRDPVHFEYPGFRAAARAAPAAPARSASTRYIALAVDFAIGLNPFIGMVELFSLLLSWGFPENELLKFFSGPAEYLIS